MNFSCAHLLPTDFADSSRVWIYQSSRPFTLAEALHIETSLQDFADAWNSHGAKVKGYANLFFGRFIIIMADETATGVSGCSTDSSVHVIKQIESLFSVNMFNRQMLAFVVKEKIEMLPMAQLPYAITNGFIHAATLYFNNTAGTKQELIQNWIIPAGESWLRHKYFTQQKL